MTAVNMNVAETVDADTGLAVMPQSSHGAAVVTFAAVAGILDTTTNPLYIYDCEAAPGSASSAAVWRISRWTIATGITLWADGNANFDNIADNRASLSYA